MKFAKLISEEERSSGISSKQFGESTGPAGTRNNKALAGPAGGFREAALRGRAARYGAQVARIPRCVKGSGRRRPSGSECSPVGQGKGNPGRSFRQSRQRRLYA